MTKTEVEERNGSVLQEKKREKKERERKRNKRRKIGGRDN